MAAKHREQVLNRLKGRDGGTSNCGGLEADLLLPLWRNSKQATVAGAKWVMGGVGGSEGRGSQGQLRCSSAF